MKRFQLVAVISMIGMAGLTLAAAGFAAAEREETRPTAPNVQTLIDRVENLEARVAELERRAPAAVLHRPVLPMPLELPKGWERKEINGLPYYIAPLQATGENGRY